MMSPSTTSALAKAMVASETSQAGSAGGCRGKHEEGERADEIRPRRHGQIFRGCARVNRPYGRNTSTSAITA